MLTLTLGMTVMAAGFALRYVFAQSPESIGMYVIMDLVRLPLSSPWRPNGDSPRSVYPPFGMTHSARTHPPVADMFPQPCFFLATDYMLLARLSFTFDQQVAERCLVIKASRLATLFVCSDVITFLLQAAGGGLMSSASGAKLGNTVRLPPPPRPLPSRPVYLPASRSSWSAWCSSSSPSRSSPVSCCSSATACASRAPRPCAA